MTFDRTAFESMLESARTLRRRRRERVARMLGIRDPAARPAPADEIDVRAVRRLTGLSQARFAELIGIELATLRNWEQGRRQPTGPARALLRAVRKDPVGVLTALSG